jgi:hypothetical protein
MADTEFDGPRRRGRPLGQKQSKETRAKISAAGIARYEAFRATLSPEEAERHLRKSEARRARLARNPHQREAKLERARKRRERKRQVAANG